MNVSEAKSEFVQYKRKRCESWLYGAVISPYQWL